MNFKVLTVLGIIFECVICWDSSENYEPEFVDPTDMGSYSHGSRRNVKPAKSRGHHEQRKYEYASESVDALTVANPEAMSLKLTEFSGGVSPPCIYQCPTLDETVVVKYMKRIVATLLEQMKVRSHVFGPGEAITIDLQAEISHEDFTTLNNFIAAKDGDCARYLGEVDFIISELLRLAPHQSSSGVEYFQQWIEMRMPTLMSFKFWLSLLSLTVVGFIMVMLCLQFSQSRHQPARFITYGMLIFFVLSCIWTYAELQEEKKAQSAARLQQYDTVPDDCNYNNLGTMQSLWYFIRVKMARYPDQCEEYYKELGMDPFHRASPIEAISGTFSKLIFHPMEYIGERMGKFFSGIIQAVPYWIQPFLLLLIFFFAFLALFGYRIRTPFVSIEPAPRPRILESPEHAVNQNQAIIERPAVPIVPANSRDASTSTDDLEDYILQQNNYRQNSRFLEPPPRTISGWPYYRDIIVSSLVSLYGKVIQVLSILLRDTPSGGGNPEYYADENMDMDLIWENPRFHQPRPILPDQEVIYPPAQMPLPQVEDDQPVNFNPVQPEASSSSSSSSDDPSIQISAYGWVHFEDDIIVVNDMPSPSVEMKRRRQGALFSRESIEGGGDGPGPSDNGQGLGFDHLAQYSHQNPQGRGDGPTDVDLGLGFDHLVENDTEHFYPLEDDEERKRKRSSSSDSDSDYFNMSNDTGFGLGEGSQSFHELDDRPSTPEPSTSNVG